jgi:antitoxin (DNA-binding transcriptional repressor) of toxin-antitoxin stability system
VSTTLSIAEAEGKLAQLLEMAQAGHDVIIEDAHRGMARLVPVRKIPSQGSRIFGLHEGETWVSDDFDAPLPDSFWSGQEKE